MAKRKKARPVSTSHHRRLRTQRILFTILAVIIVASFMLSLVT